MVYVGLGEHRVVLKFALTQGRRVASDDDKFGLARAKGLESGFVAESNCEESEN